MNYIEEALRTESTLGGDRLLHATLGIASEGLEILYSALMEDWDEYELELGDLLWYCAIAAHELGVTFDEIKVPNMEADPAVLLTDMGGVIGSMKAHLYYGTVLNKASLSYIIGRLIGQVEACAREMDLTLEDIQVKNIEKLRKRFPEKFTPELAVNRVS